MHTTCVDDTIFLANDENISRIQVENKSVDLVKNIYFETELQYLVLNFVQIIIIINEN